MRPTPPTAQQVVLTELRRGLLAGDLTPGTKIDQQALATRLGVSRVPVREALKILEGEGRVSYTAHRGCVVTELSPDELAEIHAMRRLLESEAVRQAVPKLTDADLTAMRACVKAMESGDLAAHRQFHFALFAASGQPRMLTIIGQLWDATDPYRALPTVRPSSRTAVNREHRAIVAAAKDRDTSRVVKLLDEHRDHAQQRLRAALGIPEDTPRTRRPRKAA